MRIALKLLACVFLPGLAFAQLKDEQIPPEPPREDAAPARKAGTNDLFEKVGKIASGFEKLGPWEQHHGYVMDAVGSIYERNGWNSEPDRFSLDLLREVDSKPPMAIQERFDTMVGMFSDRYLLDEKQEGALRSMMLEESLRMFTKHSDRIVNYAMEAIQTRVSGEAFTPEKVAHLVELAAPVFDEARERMGSLAKEFMGKLDPQQRALVERDLEAANNRLDWVSQKGQSWMKGEWTPEEWGLQNDPIQRAAEARMAAAVAAGADPGAGGKVAEGAGGRAGSMKKGNAAAGVAEAGGKSEPAPDGGAGAAGGPPTDARGAAGKPAVAAGAPGADRDNADAWARYVQAYINKYKLNQEQGQRAWLIHDEVKPRVEQTLKRSAERMAAGNEDAVKLAARRDADLGRLFTQMSRRLERIPTTQQRRDAAPGELPSPVATSPAQGGEKPGKAKK